MRSIKNRLTIENFGPIQSASVEFGDLTVLVGPQASGKSVFLQTLKLVIDRNHIHDTFSHHSMVFGNDAGAFLGAFYGRGMGGMLSQDPPPSVTWRGSKRDLDILTKRGSGKGSSREGTKERVFYIPAQRVVSLPGGVSTPFSSFQYGDPYVLRYFADRIHVLLQNEFGTRAELFPASNRLNATLREPIEEHIFGGAKLEIEIKEFTKSLSLKIKGLTEGLPFLAWSAGQREFVPLLLGLYWLCPAGATSTRDNIEWVVVEEPEMGLHPRAIVALLLLIVELTRRGYKVIISTHSTVVLDLVWALQTLKNHKGREGDVRRLFKLKSNPTTKQIGIAGLEKNYRVYFFERDKEAMDISSLDPSADSQETAYWGDLTGFAGRTAEIIANVVYRPRADID